MRGKALAFIGGVGVGALIMYFLDPSAGDRRRAVARDKLVKTGRQAGGAIEGSAKDLANRAKGVAARTRARFESANPSDGVLAQRVRTSLSRIVSHPKLINIMAKGGEVTLTGSVAEEEAPALSEAVRRVPGVTDVVDQTEIREKVAH